MAELWIKGKKSLNGTITVPTAKNSIMPVLAASLLCGGATTLCRVPQLEDVVTSLALLRALGAKAAMAGDRVTITAPASCEGLVPAQLSSAMRSSVFYLAPLLVKSGRVSLPMPGGCKLGARPIDLHLAGLAAMGAKIEQDAQQVTCRLEKPLRGAGFCLALPSVGATETLMMAACCAKGETVLCGCAKEPEVVDLARYLSACGAQITGAGGSCITIKGGAPLTGCRFTPVADRITAATVLCATAACGGDVTLQGARYEHLIAILRRLSDAGAQVSRPAEGVVRLQSDGTLRAVDVTTGYYPGFATDAGPLYAAAMLRATGSCGVTETIFENRFACADGFRALGARALVEKSTLTMQGVKELTGARVTAPDLRGGAALVLAALQAQGESRVAGCSHIARGYADIAALFAPLGAQIGWAEPEQPA